MRPMPSVIPASLAALCVTSIAAQAEEVKQKDLSEMSLEELSNLEVTSVSRAEEPLSTAAAAIAVITHDDIRRSGATSIPEALRLAPGLHVGRVSSSSWAVSARGFSSV